MSVAGPGYDLEKTLREQFGLAEFRPGQREAIEPVLGGRDVLCVMPTGGGKSLCYQLPAQVLPGVTLVVSPLIALMKDQVDALNARGLSATLINSTLDLAEQRARLLEVEAGLHRIIYVAPERFRSGRFVSLMARLRPSLLAIDEAHCISQWGHDFRPDYARLGLARKQLGSPPCIALTATATDAVRRDIADQLELRDPELIITGFDRPNLKYSVVEAGKDEAKLQELARALDRNPGPAVVYASSRVRCEMVAAFLGSELRRETVVYHAGLTREQRNEAQERFMGGRADVVVATNAFGMGVDKRDIRAVVHFNLPGTLEAYYQEAGRAGRDGQPGACVLIYSYGDRFLQEMFIDNEYPPRGAVHQVYEFLRRRDDDPIQLTHAEIKEEARLDMNESAIGSVLKILDNAGAIEKFLPRENQAIVRINVEPDDLGVAPSLVDRLSPQAHVQQIVLRGLEGLVRGRVGEPVYFRPDELAEALGLDRPALGRAIKSLVAELPIDYVPPFRGNAIRVVDRAKRPRDLKIDFSELEKRKEHEYAKLERMIEYSRTRQCRRAYILRYFGEKAALASAGECGGCDNCRPGDASGPSAFGVASSTMPIDTPGGRDLLLKILSGVARAKGRFGKQAVAMMLTGSDSEKMAKSRLDQLSTFGILRDSGLRQKEVADVLDALAKARLVESQEVDRFKPVITLTEAGWEYLKNAEAPAPCLDLPDFLVSKLRRGGPGRSREAPHSPSPRDDAPGAAAPRGAPALEAAGDDPDEASPADDLAPDPLRDRLRALRTDWARELKQPAYCIFTNETLEAIVRDRPATPAELAGVKGLGRARVERHGTAILEAIAAYPRDGAAARSAASPPGAVSRELGSVSEPTPAKSPAGPSSPARRAEPAPTGNTAGGAPPARRAEPAPAGNEPAPAGSRVGSHVATEEWTHRLIAKGFSVAEAAAIRGLDVAAVVRHLTWMVRRGQSIDPSSLAEAEALAAWEEWRASRGDDAPPPGDDLPPGLWSLYLLCRPKA
ncbi:ATP-dependent DNA helicase RecQ [Aquisphaera giovannonii]|uniref:ATP-dependent DNA helicase RecQ n=1 Tax=Aquisphaera giovannonii TaxID=406548 RepID=A0A5B9VXF0_9BACT|nr:ATP-dependent DNA helicase RecQ [Aquisphaera giovannonii]QEH32637.1 ATP-dependent DNA helicase RecQ [Aquisphaera giovannonii]